MRKPSQYCQADLLILRLQTFQVRVQLFLAVDNLIPGHFPAFVCSGPAENCHKIAANARRNRWVIELALSNTLVECLDVGNSAFLIYARAFSAALEILAADDHQVTIRGLEHPFRAEHSVSYSFRLGPTTVDLSGAERNADIVRILKEQREVVPTCADGPYRSSARSDGPEGLGIHDPAHYV